MKRSHPELLFLHDKFKRDKLQEKVPCEIPPCSSVLRSIAHGADLLVPESNGNMEYSSDSEHSDMTIEAWDDAYKPEEDDQLVPLTQAELKDLTRDLNLSKESVRLLSSRLKEKHLFASRNNVLVVLRPRERELRQFFTFLDKSSLVYCINIAGLIKSMSLDYDATEWGLFIDTPNGSLKAVLLHNGNSFSSIPIGHPVQMNGTQNRMDHLLSAVNYKRLSCEDLKVVGLVLGIQGGYTSYPCFLSLWGSQADD